MDDRCNKLATVISGANYADDSGDGRQAMVKFLKCRLSNSVSEESAIISWIADF